MKKLMILLPLVVACNKKEAVTEVHQNQDSAKIIVEQKGNAQVDSAKIKDSVVNNAPATKEVLRTGVMRDVEAGTIVREATAEMLPFSIGEELTAEHSKFILKIKDFPGGKISAKLSPEIADANLRISQIRLPNGETDGPLGRAVSGYAVGMPGEVWIVVGKSDMASGTSVGRFSLKVE